MTTENGNRRINYQLLLDRELEAIRGAERKPRLLLHACCAPCSSYVLEYLSEFFDITLFYFNPNIAPEAEFDFRVSELRRLVSGMPLRRKPDITVGEYDPARFYAAAAGHWNEPEGGERCFRCYRLRLEESAAAAARGGYDYFTTTLSISPYKNAARLNEIGRETAEKYGVRYLFSDFKKKGGYLRSIALSGEYRLYRQDYCGCVYSKQAKLKGETVKNTFEKAREFIYRNACPLDFARFRYHFENGSRDEVLAALAHYQNVDGGFGHALEADSWNPNSSPINTWTATEILREIGFEDAEHPIIRGILRYLESGADFDGHFWYCKVGTNNDYPHAQWWHTDGDDNCGEDYNPTVNLAGFIIRFAGRDSALYALGCRIIREAYAQLTGGRHEYDMHTMTNFIRMLEYCRAAGAEVVDLGALEAKLRELVAAQITRDTEKWNAGYICRPSRFIDSRESVFYAGNEEISEYECEFIVQSQLEDGTWIIPWNWKNYPEQWAISKNRWRAVVIIENLLYLKGFGLLT